MNKQFYYWGIDGCKAGWFCIGLNSENSYKFFVASDISEIYECLKKEEAKIALIDIPIGLSDTADERSCDKKARKYVGTRSSSVFRVPCRQAIHAYRNEKGDKKDKIKAGKTASVEVTGGCLSEQTWGIVPKIEQVDSFLNCEDVPTKKQRRKLFRETHPEVCFCALNNEISLAHGKKANLQGLKERIAILEKQLPNVCQIFDDVNSPQVGGDDVHDALIAAVTAKIGDNKYKTLPADPPKDSCGLPMEMVHI